MKYYEKDKVKALPFRDAVGKVLLHDITRIVPDLFKGPLFRKGHIITYGAPVLPGAMFMLAYINDIPVIGLPGCVMYHRASIFDLVVPRVLAGETVEKKDIIMMGHGGFCSNCKDCRYPDCSFGK